MRDEIIPVDRCVDETTKAIWKSNTIKKYCPQFSDSDFIYGDYFSEKFSWYRLVIHTCDLVERAAEGKTCKSPEEIDEYFR